MAYATRQQLILRIGEQELIQLTDRQGIAGEIDSDVLAAAQDASCGEIDGYLSDGGNATPLETPPQRVVTADVALTRWYLYTGPRPKEVEADATLARDWLREIASGKHPLCAADAPELRVTLEGGRNLFSGGGY